MTTLLAALGFFLSAQQAQALAIAVDGCNVQAYGHPEVVKLQNSPVCGQKDYVCKAPPGAVCVALASEQRTYPNCKALMADGARFLHFGRCQGDQPPAVSVAVGVSFHSYRDCVRKVRRIDPFVSVAPWREFVVYPSDDQAVTNQGGGAAKPAIAKLSVHDPARSYCRRLFPDHGVWNQQDDEELEPQEVEGHSPPETTGGVLPPGHGVKKLH